MKIIFEDGREVETENPVRELTNVIFNRTMAYDNNRKLRWPDYIFVLRGYKVDTLLHAGNRLLLYERKD